MWFCNWTSRTRHVLEIQQRRKFCPSLLPCIRLVIPANVEVLQLCQLHIYYIFVSILKIWAVEFSYPAARTFLFPTVLEILDETNLAANFWTKFLKGFPFWKISLHTNRTILHVLFKRLGLIAREQSWNRERRGKIWSPQWSSMTTRPTAVETEVHPHPVRLWQTCC